MNKLRVGDTVSVEYNGGIRKLATVVLLGAERILFRDSFGEYISKAYPKQIKGA